MKKAKRYLLTYVGVASTAYLATFLLTYEAELLGAPSAVRYLCELLLLLTDMLVPLCAAALLLPRLTACTKRALAWQTAIVALPILPDRFPDMYLFLLNGGLDSLESCGVGLLFSLGYAFLYGAVYYLLFLVMRTLLRRAEVRGGAPTPAMRPNKPFEGGPWLTALAVFALPHTLLTWIRAIVDTVAFLSDYFLSFTLGEIVYMAVSLVFPPLAMILSLYVAIRICMRITAEQTAPPRRPA